MDELLFFAPPGWRNLHEPPSAPSAGLLVLLSDGSVVEAAHTGSPDGFWRANLGGLRPMAWRQATCTT